MNANRIHRVLALLGAGGLLLVAGGCLAAGRNDYTGEIVVGVPIGQLVETANQALAAGAKAAAGFLGLPPGVTEAVAGVIGLGWAKSHANAAAANAAAAEVKAAHQRAIAREGGQAQVVRGGRGAVSGATGNAVGGPAGTPVQS